MSWNNGGGPWQEYWPQWNAHYRPMAVQRPRLHQAAVTAPTPYAGGRRPLLSDLPGPFVPGPGVGAPVYGSSVRQVGPWRRQEQPLYQDFNAPARPAPLEVNFECKSIEATVRWTHPYFSRDSRINYRYEVSVQGGSNNETLELPQWRVNMRLRVSPGTWYKVEVRAVSGRRVIAEGTVEFKSVFDRTELWNLHNKAVSFCGDQMHRFEVFYRNKPEPYWDNIRFNRNELMEKYIKDGNGQAASPINDTINGLFFSSNLTKGSRLLPSTSPFGNVRLVVSAEKLLNPQMKLYFADFYCTYSTHYVTVVGCVPGSDTDRFCERALIPLNNDNNVFLRVYQTPGWLEFWVNENVWVEYLYTENVPLSLGSFNRVHSTGCSTPGGLPNNKYCGICNLYPVVRIPQTGHKRASREESEEEERKRRRTGEEEEEEDLSEDEGFNSTFHLAMELERDRLGPDCLQPGNVEVLETVCALVDSVIPEVGKCVEVPNHGNVGKSAPQWIQDFKAQTEKLRQELAESEARQKKSWKQNDPPTPEVTLTEEKSAAEQASDQIEETLKAVAAKPDPEEGVNKENLSREGEGLLDQLKAGNNDLDVQCQNLQLVLRSLQDNLIQIEKRTRKR